MPLGPCRCADHEATGCECVDLALRGSRGAGNPREPSSPKAHRPARQADRGAGMLAGRSRRHRRTATAGASHHVVAHSTPARAMLGHQLSSRHDGIGRVGRRGKERESRRCVAPRPLRRIGPRACAPRPGPADAVSGPTPRSGAGPANAVPGLIRASTRPRDRGWSPAPAPCLCPDPHRSHRTRKPPSRIAPAQGAHHARMPQSHWRHRGHLSGDAPRSQRRPARRAALSRHRRARPLPVAATPVRRARAGHGPGRGGHPHGARQDGLGAARAVGEAREPTPAEAHRLRGRPPRHRRPDGGSGARMD